MNDTALGVVGTVATAALALALLLQIVDVTTGHMVRRAGRAAGSRDRDRVLTWIIALSSVALVLLIVGVNVAVRLLVDAEQALLGLLFLVALAGVCAILAILSARALRRPQTGFQGIRDELSSTTASRLSRGRIADYRRWVETLDARHRDLHRRIIVGRIVRCIPPLIALVVVVVAFWLSSLGTLPAIVAVLSVVPLVITIWLGLSGARISLARNLALTAMHGKLRAEVLLALDDLERKAPRKVNGLTERVSRALAILREQQGQQDPR